MRRRILVVPTVLAVTFAASVVACEDQPEGQLPGPTVDAPVSVDAAITSDDAVIASDGMVDAPPDAAIDARPDGPVG